MGARLGSMVHPAGQPITGGSVMTRFGKMIAVLIAALVTGGISAQASANTTYGCTVTDVGVWGAYNGGNPPTVPALSITCGGAAYYTNQYVPAMGGSCPGTSA